MTHSFFHSPLGTIGLETNGVSLTRIHLLGTEKPDSFETQCGPDLLKEAKKQILAFLRGELKTFNLSFELAGTDFQKEVWQAMATVPYGKLVSYSDLAREIGKPRAVRAIGGAANKNPLPLLIPCHRVVGKSGDLVGFAPGVSFKKQLLELEGHKVNQNSIS